MKEMMNDKLRSIAPENDHRSTVEYLLRGAYARRAMTRLRDSVGRSRKRSEQDLSMLGSLVIMEVAFEGLVVAWPTEFIRTNWDGMGAPADVLLTQLSERGVLQVRETAEDPEYLYISIVPGLLDVDETK